MDKQDLIDVPVRPDTSNPWPDKISKLLELARCAPPAPGMPVHHAPQPWRAHLMTDGTRAKCVDALQDFADRLASESTARQSRAMASLPAVWRSDWLPDQLQRENMDALADRLQPERKRLSVQQRRCAGMFNAQAVLLLTVERRVQHGRWLEHGMFIRNVIWAAEMSGLTAGTHGLAPFDLMIRDLAGIHPAEALVCGITIDLVRS